MGHYTYEYPDEKYTEGKYDNLHIITTIEVTQLEKYRKIKDSDFRKSGNTVDRD